MQDDTAILNDLLRTPSGTITLEPRPHYVHAIVMTGTTREVTIDLNGGSICALPQEGPDPRRHGLLEFRHDMHFYDPAADFASSYAPRGTVGCLRIVNGTFDGMFDPQTPYVEDNMAAAEAAGLKVQGISQLVSDTGGGVQRVELKDLTIRRFGTKGAGTQNVPELLIENCTFEHCARHPIGVQQNKQPLWRSRHVWRNSLVRDCGTGGDWTTEDRNKDERPQIPIDVLWENITIVDPLGQTKMHAPFYGLTLRNVTNIHTRDDHLNIYSAFVQRSPEFHYLNVEGLTAVGCNRGALELRQTGPMGTVGIHELNAIDCCYELNLETTQPVAGPINASGLTYQRNVLSGSPTYQHEDHWFDRLSAVKLRMRADGHENMFPNHWNGGSLKRRLREV